MPVWVLPKLSVAFGAKMPFGAGGVYFHPGALFFFFRFRFYDRRNQVYWFWNLTDDSLELSRYMLCLGPPIFCFDTFFRVKINLLHPSPPFSVVETSADLWIQTSFQTCALVSSMLHFGFHFPPSSQFYSSHSPPLKFCLPASSHALQIPGKLCRKMAA